MANWTGAILTNKGRALAAKVEAGTCKLELTKLKVGDGTPSDLESMTDLASPKQNIGISSITPSEAGECDIECVITNKDLDKGFYMREMGIFATDPDEGEILYAVQTDTHPDYLQGKGTSATLSIALHVTIAITNTDSVTAVINPAGLLTSADLDKHNTSDDAHFNLFKLFAKLTDLKTHNEAADAHENRFKLFEKIENLGDDIIKKLALTTTISAVTALQTNSWFGQLLKLVLTASGVKYSIAQNGYVCLGSFFGGLIIQWGNCIPNSDADTEGTITLNIAAILLQALFTDRSAEAYGPIKFDVCWMSDNQGVKTTSIYWKAVTAPHSFTWVAITKI